MKKIIVLVFLYSIFTSISCSDNDSSNKDISLTITQTKWYTYTEQSENHLFGYLVLHIEGYTNGEKVTIRTAGDGLSGYVSLKLDVNKYFNDDVHIAFTHQADITKTISGNTEVTAYENATVPEITCGDVGSGNSKTISLESGQFTF